MLILDTDRKCNCAVPVITVGSEQCTVEFAAAAHGGIARMWFRFWLYNDGRDQLPPTLVLRLKHIMTMLDGSCGNFRPVINYGVKWHRLPAAEICRREDGHQELEWKVQTPAPGEELQVAFCYPYADAELDALLKDTAGYWRCDEIGVSGGDRSVKRLANQYGLDNSSVPGLFLFARQHAGEVAGSWVLDGVLRYLAEVKPEVQVWCVPFADTDGVAEENYGKDSFPWDLNRAWGPHAMMRHETCVFANDLAIWRQRVNPSASFVIDFHSPGASETGCYAFVNEEVPRENLVYAMLCECKNALGGYASDNFILHARYKPFSAWGDFADLGEYAWKKLGIPAVSLETSYFECGGKVMSEDDYRSIGRILAEQMVNAVLSASVNR